MAKYSNTKAKINEKITTNGAQSITGNVLNEVLQTMVDSLGADYQFGGLVQPGSTFTAGEQPVVFLATTPGTYTNFGGIVVADGEVALLVWSGTAWSKQTPDIATRTEVSQLGQYIGNTEWVQVVTDDEDKILYGVKTDGKFYFGDGCPPQVIEYVTAKLEELEGDFTTLLNTKVDKVTGKSLIDSDFASAQEVIINPEYIQVTTDKDGKILEGIKQDGTKVIGSPLELPRVRQEEVYNPDFIQVTTDEEGKIIEGINTLGEKHISKFDTETEDMIKEFVDIPESIQSVISIPLLDANFTSPVPVIITGNKGDENAKYEFALPLSADAYNIRFKFKITENILNQVKNSVIAKLGGANAISATIQALSQLISSVSYEGEVKTMYWPTLRGGIKLNGSSVSRTTNSGDKQNIGNFAFYVYYVGDATSVTIQNTGQALVIKVDGVTTTLSYSTYPTVAELYEAVKALSDFEVSYNELEARNCTELAIFPECTLVNTYYTGVNGRKDDPIVEYQDSAPFFIPYAVCEEWHQAEIVKIGDKVYAACDGTTIEIEPNGNNLVLGGACGCLFKDLEINIFSSDDAEVVDGQIISCVNPHIIIHEGHDIIQTPTNEIIDQSGNLGTTTDRLQLIYTKMIGKGYVPVSLDEIADYYAGNRQLPKRCFTSIFDDYRWVNCLDIDNRAVFTRFGVKPALAIITSWEPSTILHNGVEITIQQASVICRNYRFGLASHTRNHRDCNNVKPSNHFGEIIADVYDGDIKGIDNSILVYPYGHAPIYLTDVLKWLGFRLGVNIVRNGYNIKNRSRYNLTRVEIGVLDSISDILNTII